MIAPTIDRLLRVPRNATRSKKRRRATPELRRRVPVRTFADWNEPLPGTAATPALASNDGIIGMLTTHLLRE
jgi:hypothetical protein